MREDINRKRKREEEDYYSIKSKGLSQTDEVAKERYEKYESCDPFPNIEAALLNSADIFRYVTKTGMIYPFHWKKLEGASYEVDIKGTVMWWNEDGEMESKELINPGDSFELKPNSIAFITLEPTFRIPDYIALRFNLKIVHVYRGLLLGTGPLVDPGFVGKLSLPLHNLTDNTYVFRAGDGIIQMEFTKLSRNMAWFPRHTSNAVYIRKRIAPGRTVKDYIERSLGAGQNKVIRSSIPGEIKKIRDEASKVQEEAVDFRKRIRKDFKELKIETGQKIHQAQWLNVAIIAAVASVMAFACTAMYQLGSANTVKKSQITELEKQYISFYNEYENREKELEQRIKELEDELKEMKNEEEEGKANVQKN